jgi:hypothetical protein
MARAFTYISDFEYLSRVIFEHSVPLVTATNSALIQGATLYIYNDTLKFYQGQAFSEATTSKDVN